MSKTKLVVAVVVVAGFFCCCCCLLVFVFFFLARANVRRCVRLADSSKEKLKQYKYFC